MTGRGERDGFDAVLTAARDDLLATTTLDRLPPWLRPYSLFQGLVSPFARRVHAFDRQVDAEGLSAAARTFLQDWGVVLEVRGPRPATTHPLIVLSNHPGITDSLALMAALQDRNLKLFAKSNRFLRALPATRHHLLLLEDESAPGRSPLRAAVRHLKAGGALATYPAGRIEPDPAHRPDAIASIAGWSPSLGFFARLVPEAHVVLAMVRGCIHPVAQRHVLTRIRREPAQREEVGAMVQVLFRRFRAGRVEIDFSPAIRAGELLERFGEAGLHEAITGRARRLMLARDVEEGWPGQVELTAETLD